MPDDFRHALPPGWNLPPPDATGGRRWYVPGSNETDVIRVMPGDPRLNVGNVHSGPYAMFSRTGLRHPLKGNRAPWPPAPSTEAEFQDDVMLDAVGDPIGLWEVTSLARAAFPDRSPSDASAIAKRVVTDLLDRGWVELLEKRIDPLNEGRWLPPAVVTRDRVAAAVADDAGWSADDVVAASVQHLISASERGGIEFRDDLTRRGLLADEPARRRKFGIF